MTAGAVRRVRLPPVETGSVALTWRGPSRRPPVVDDLGGILASILMEGRSEGLPWGPEVVVPPGASLFLVLRADGALAHQTLASFGPTDLQELMALRLGDPDLASMCHLTDLRRLIVSGPVTGRGLAALARLQRLECLSIPGLGPAVDDAAELARLRSLEALRVLTISAQRVEGALGWLAALGNLQVLAFQRSPLRASSLAGLRDVPGLLELRLAETAVDDGLVDVLSGLSLVGLVLDKSGVTEAGVVGCLEGLPSLQLLSVAGIRLSARGCDAIASHPQLRVLGIGPADLDEADRRRLASRRPELFAHRPPHPPRPSAGCKMGPHY